MLFDLIYILHRCRPLGLWGSLSNHYSSPPLIIKRSTFLHPLRQLIRFASHRIAFDLASWLPPQCLAIHSSAALLELRIPKLLEFAQCTLYGSALTGDHVWWWGDEIKKGYDRDENGSSRPAICQRKGGIIRSEVNPLILESSQEGLWLVCK